MMKKILVPTDFSENAKIAAEYAIAMANEFNAKITLYHAFQVQVATGSFASTKHFFEQDAKENMKKMVQSLTHDISEQADMEAVVVQGDAIACIVDRANKMNYDLVVMGTKGATGLKEVFLGSVTSTILQKVNIPILAIPAAFQFEQIKTIVLAIDSQGVQQDATLRPLIDLAKALHATIRIYHLIEEEEESDLDIAPEIDLLLQEIPHAFHVEIKSLNVNEAINNFVAAQQADLLCMIRRKKTFWDRLFFGSSTIKEVFDSPVPLLVLQE
jgi:nucleotide-binding universal stress UspA family protein